MCRERLALHFRFRRERLCPAEEHLIAAREREADGGIDAFAIHLKQAGYVRIWDMVYRIEGDCIQVCRLCRQRAGRHRLPDREYPQSDERTEISSAQGLPTRLS